MSAVAASTWKKARLGDLLTVIRGVSYKKEDASSESAPGRVPILRATNIQNGLVFEDFVYVPRQRVSDDQFLRKGDIVVAASSGSRNIVGKAAPLTKDWYGSFGTFCFGLRPKPGIDPCYLAWFLQTSEYRHQVSELSAGVNINNLRSTHIEGIPIAVAPPSEQRRIVAEIEKQFTRLDAGVAALRRVQANLKRYRAAVLKAACEGRLVPPEAELAKAEGRNFESGEQLLTRILADRRKNWQGRGKYKEPSAPEPAIGAELSNGWTWTGFEQLADGTKNAIKAGPFGSALKKSSYAPSGYKIYGQEQVIRGDPYYGDYFISSDLFERLSSCEAKAGDILISLVGTAGKVLVLPEDCASGIINPRLLKLSLHGSGVNPKFIKILLESATTRMFFKLAAHGGTMEILNLGILKLLPVPLPPLAEQTRIVAEVEQRLSVVEELEAVVAANLARAARLRQSILQRAFSAEPSRRELSGLDARKQG